MSIDVDDTTLQQQIEGILEQHRLLSDYGYGSYPNSKGMQEHQALRAALLTPDSVEAIAKLCGWIRTNLRERLNVNNRHSSYELKHIAEKDVGYVSNGQFIVAALLCGYKMGKRPRINPSFNIEERSIKEAYTVKSRGK